MLRPGIDCIGGKVSALKLNIRQGVIKLEAQALRQLMNP